MRMLAARVIRTPFFSQGCAFFFQAEDGIRDIGVTGVQTCALPIWKNDQADATVDGIASETPHASEIRRAAHVRHGNVSEALHQPTVNRNFKMRFEFPATNTLWNRAIEREWIENIDMVRHEGNGLRLI